MEKKVIYEIVHPSGSFTNKGFPTLDEARKARQYDLDGCPGNSKMSETNRAYWRKMGAECKIYRVESTIIRQEVL